MNHVKESHVKNESCDVFVTLWVKMMLRMFLEYAPSRTGCLIERGLDSVCRWRVFMWREGLCGVTCPHLRLSDTGASAEMWAFFPKPHPTEACDPSRDTHVCISPISSLSCVLVPGLAVSTSTQTRRRISSPSSDLQEMNLTLLKSRHGAKWAAAPSYFP